jgi:hypothetical protein
MFSHFKETNTPGARRFFDFVGPVLVVAALSFIWGAAAVSFGQAAVARARGMSGAYAGHAAAAHSEPISAAAADSKSLLRH